MSRRPFLTARWADLVILTWPVPPGLLEPSLPPGCRLDHLAGQAFVSLVAFDFLETRVLGVSWPGFRSFPEVNLRFYVQEGPDRGVCFLREYVPSRVVAGLARALYHEPYRAASMTSRVERSAGGATVEHRLTRQGRASTVRVEAQGPPFTPGEDSEAEFFKEHRWGFGRTRGGRLLRYEVVHPRWAVDPVRRVVLDWDFAGLYGPEWAFLAESPWRSALLARGSPVAVYPGTAGGAR